PHASGGKGSGSRSRRCCPALFMGEGRLVRSASGAGGWLAPPVLCPSPLIPLPLRLRRGARGNAARHSYTPPPPAPAPTPRKRREGEQIGAAFSFPPCGGRMGGSLLPTPYSLLPA